jgi:hypothetical protein
MQVILFIDYDNLVGSQKRAGILAAATKALLSTALKTTASQGRCDVRIYGGWYEGTSLTPLAQKIVAEVTRIDAFASTTIASVHMAECTVDALFDMSRGLSYFEPAAVKAHVLQLGFTMPEMAVELQLQENTLRAHEDSLIQFEKLLRYFIRSTHISESVIRMKLGGKSSTFIADVIPALVNHGILVQMDNRSGDQQRRFKLGRQMTVLNRALEDCDGQFNRFVSLLAHSGAR